VKPRGTGNRLYSWCGISLPAPLRSVIIRGAMLTGNKWAISNNYAEVEQLFDNPLRSAPWSSTERCWPFKTWNFHLEGILYFLKNQTAISNSYVEVKPRGTGKRLYSWCGSVIRYVERCWPSLSIFARNKWFFFLFAILNNYAQVEQTKRNHGECGICVEI